MSASIQLALIFKCSPYTFLGKPGHEIERLYELTNHELREMGEE